MERCDCLSLQSFPNEHLRGVVRGGGLLGGDRRGVVRLTGEWTRRPPAKLSVGMEALGQLA